MKAEYPPKIENLITTLNSKLTWKNNEVATVIKKLNIKQEDVANYQHFNHHTTLSYGRTCIYENNNFRLLLMSWCPGDVTAIHDHGRTDWGGVLFFGDMTHRLYTEKLGTLATATKNKMKKDSFVPITGNIIHLMANKTEKNIATLHIYGFNKPLNEEESKAIIYAPEYNKKIHTAGSAYVNMKKEYALFEENLPKMKEDDFKDYINIVKPFYARNNNLHLINNAI